MMPNIDLTLESLLSMDFDVWCHSFKWIYHSDVCHLASVYKLEIILFVISNHAPSIEFMLLFSGLHAVLDTFNRSGNLIGER